MCFEFSSCFGNGRSQDYGGERPTHNPPHGGGRGRRGNCRDDYGVATDHKQAPAATYHHQPPTAIHEAGHKAYHDGARKDHQTHAGGHAGYAAYVQDKQADSDTPKLPAWHNKVGDDTGYIYAYTARPHEAAADRRQNAAMDYNHYPTTTTNTTALVRY